MSLNLNTIAPQLPATTPVSPTKLKSPKKLASWNVRVIDGTIDLSPPTKVRKKLFEEDLLGDLIYRYINNKTGRRYYGSVVETENNNLLKRLNTYNGRVNKEGIKRTYIENAIHANPEDYSIGIVEVKKGATEKEIHVLEEGWQDLFGTRNRKYGYNQSQPTKEPNRVGPKKPKSGVKKVKVITSIRTKGTERKAFLVAKTNLANQKS